jgi:hypothetical protein
LFSGLRSSENEENDDDNSGSKQPIKVVAYIVKAADLLSPSVAYHCVRYIDDPGSRNHDQHEQEKN